MKTCVCNKEINDEYEFCPYCGEYVGNKKGYGIYSIKTNNVDLGIFKGTISDIAFYLSKCNLKADFRSRLLNCIILIFEII